MEGTMRRDRAAERGGTVRFSRSSFAWNRTERDSKLLLSVPTFVGKTGPYCTRTNVSHTTERIAGVWIRKVIRRIGWSVLYALIQAIRCRTERYSTDIYVFRRPFDVGRSVLCIEI
jgi:hypothetical protein